jgi:hypothetical protein
VLAHRLEVSARVCGSIARRARQQVPDDFECLRKIKLETLKRLEPLLRVGDGRA